MHPGQKNNLDALCSRYMVDNTQRTLHGALLDSEILADVYVAMTGGQTGLFEEAHGGSGEAGGGSEIRRLDPNRPPLAVVQASVDELQAHEAWLDKLEQDSPNGALWRRLTEISG
jgi:DNA polymerase-3 subunit epsilon